MRQKNNGFDTKFGFGIHKYGQTRKKKNIGFLMKCGFDINKEIKDNEAEK